MAADSARVVYVPAVDSFELSLLDRGFIHSEVRLSASELLAFFMAAQKQVDAWRSRHGVPVGDCEVCEVG